MGKIIFVTGGARSGKSTFAENQLKNEKQVTYIATAIPFDEEMQERIAIHRKRRNEGWQTLEAYCDLASRIREKAEMPEHILLDCITVMVTNLMIMDNNVEWETAGQDYLTILENEIRMEIENFLAIKDEIPGNIVIVSNEVGMGLVPETPLGRHFRDIAGRMNQLIAREADEAYFVVSGIPMQIK